MRSSALAVAPAVALAPGLLLLSSVPAAAHTANSLALGFSGGFLHPLSGADHLLAMIAVGLWGAFLGRPLVYVLPVVFAAMMAAGGMLGMAGTSFPPVEVGIAASVLLLGAAVLAKWRAPAALAAVAVGLSGLFHGYAHGLELPAMADPAAFGLGFVLATGLSLTLGTLAGSMRARPLGEAVLRAIGGAFAVAGMVFLASAGAGAGAGA